MKSYINTLVLSALLLLVPAASVSAVTQPKAPVAQAARHVLTRELVTEVVVKAVTSQFSTEGDLEVEVLSSLPRVAASPEVWHVEVTGFPSALSSISQLRIRCSSGTQQYSDFPINVRVQNWREVWVARDAVEREAIFDPSLLDTRRVDVIKERNVVPVAAVTTPMTFRTQVAAGKLLTWRDIERRALVRKGEVVEVVASDGQLTVKMKALAMQSGSAGEMIVVRNMQSKRDITAQVVAENLAHVRF